MAFEHWAIPGGQEGEGRNLHDALENAVGRAILADNIKVSDMPPGWCYDLSTPNVENELGLAVISQHLAVLVSMPWLPESVWTSGSDEVLSDSWPRIRMMPEDVGFQTMHQVLFKNEVTGRVGAIVFGAVRHVDSTPAHTDWLLKKHEL